MMYAEKNATEIPSSGDAFPSLLSKLEKGYASISLLKTHGASRAYLLARLLHAKWGPWVCIAANEEKADELATDLVLFLGADQVLRLPASMRLPYDVQSRDRENAFKQLEALTQLVAKSPAKVLVISARALQQKYIPVTVVKESLIHLQANQDFDRDRLIRHLLSMGYRSAPVVEEKGCFAVRGSILDAWSVLYDRPARLEFFGDTLESLRIFDPDTQRTIKTIENISFCLASELLFEEKNQIAAITAIRQAADTVNFPSSKLREILDYIGEGKSFFRAESFLPGFYSQKLSSIFDYASAWSAKPLLFIDDMEAVGSEFEELDHRLTQEFTAARGRQELVMEPAEHFLTAKQVSEQFSKFSTLIARQGVQFPDQSLVFSYGTTLGIRQEILAHHGEEGALTPLIQKVCSWRERGVFTAIACASSGQAERLKRLLLDRRLMVKVHHLGQAIPVNPADEFEPAVHVHLFPAEISAGFLDISGKLALLSEEDVLGQRSRKAIRHTHLKRDLSFVHAFRELKEGDLIVHIDYGIGRYLGLVRLSLRGVDADVLILEYAGKDKVYLPVQRMRLLQKFNGADAQNVALDRLGSGSWEKRKKAVKEHLLQMAAELLKIYAARKAHPGTAFTPPDSYFRQFEADFPFEETPDQQKAIEEVLADMQLPEPMDRLVCGDVGYGKTEVALRAAFKSVLDKKQVAVLVPTTVLAAQHFRIFKERFKDYPVNIDMVSRMRTSRENREVIRLASQGRLDILIGTHRILNTDVSFSDLGLLIVDEEQRFGVAHKEKLKKYRSQVDVLTMTATPIPRTLNMAMSGLRDMSIIATPPEDRKAIRTFVLKFDTTKIAEAIRHELARNGQVYFVHNRVESIQQIAKQLSDLVPEARYAIAHGQMAEGALEKVMTEFIERKHDVLIASSIIESGLDIPSANTIIVNRADTFGLAQLYQIRGRVGRGKERAYAYLLIPPQQPLTKEANRRLEVLESLTELGAGFSIASHDLEIRGAGNLLGSSQSGQIAAVGFDLYTQLMDEAVAQLRGEPPQSILDPDVRLPIPALIPEDYVPDIHLRLLFYKRFSQLQNHDELSDLRGEMSDRFGELPYEVDNLSEVMLLKADMRRLRLRSLESGPSRIVVVLGSDARLDPQKMTALVQRSQGNYRLTPEMKLIAITRSSKGDESGLLGEARRILGDLLVCERE